MIESKQYSPEYIEDYVHAVKSWLRRVDIKIRREIRITDLCQISTLQNARVPNAYEMVDTTNKRILPESLIQEIHDSYKHSEILLDLEQTKDDLIVNQKEQMQSAIHRPH